MKTFTNLFVLLAATLLISCEGYRCAIGTIKDKTSSRPLDSVYVKVVTGSKKIYTDSTGAFDVCNGMGGCSFGCKDIMVEFSKPGYKTQTVQNPNKDIIILLERQ